MSQCDECGAGAGLHQKSCDKATSGIGIGMRRRRNDVELAAWEQVKTAVFARDRCCQYPRCFAVAGLHPHHVKLVQQVQADGGTWADADQPDNVRALCATHHAWAHDAINIEKAVEYGLRIPTESKIFQPTEDTTP